MKNKILGVIALLTIAGFLSIKGAYPAADIDKNFDEISADMRAKGIEKTDIDAVQNQLKEMLERGHSPESLKATMTDLSDNGIKGNDFRKTVDLMNEIERNGASADDASNMVSRAIQDSKDEGKEGAGLAESTNKKLKQMYEDQKNSKPGMDVSDKSMNMENSTVPERDIPERTVPERATDTRRGMNK